MFDRTSCITGGAGFLPSTVVLVLFVDVDVTKSCTSWWPTDVGQFSRIFLKPKVGNNNNKTGQKQIPLFHTILTKAQQRNMEIWDIVLENQSQVSLVHSQGQISFTELRHEESARDIGYLGSPFSLSIWSDHHHGERFVVGRHFRLSSSGQCPLKMAQ